MKFFAVSLPVGWTALAVLLAGTSWVAAQQSTIQFTKPADADLGKANAFLPAPASQLTPGAFNAPAPLFGSRTPTVSFDVLPGSPRPVIAPNSQWQKAMDAKKNWSLMTPEEILNIPTPEKLLGVTDSQDDPKLSSAERFLERQRQEDITTASNSLVRADAYSRDNQIQFSDANSPFGQTLTRSSADLAKKSAGVFGEWNLGSAGNADRDAVSGWSSPFGQALPKPTPEALAGMDRFRELMEAPAPEKASVAPASMPYQPANFKSPNQPSSSPAPRRSAINGLEDSIGRPVGLTPLRHLNDPQPTPAKKPTSLTQPPPWLNNGPQTFQQRQF